jgi:hypothetical protein
MSGLSRRDFHKLAMAAMGGITVAGISGGALAGSHEEKKAAKEVHACRGLNSCKGNGGCGEHPGQNECAGMGGCATAERHGCSGHNTCKGQGGCGEAPGDNACKGQGGCQVPLMESAWKKARANFEAKMKKSGKKFGAAPLAKKG